MHDWTLLSIHIDWPSGNARLEIKDPTSTIRILEIRELLQITVPRRNPWGESISINESTQSTGEDTKVHKLSIEMQSGDVIQIEAGFISKL